MGAAEGEDCEVADGVDGDVAGDVGEEGVLELPDADGVD